MIRFVVDEGELTVGRAVASYVYGAWSVEWVEGTPPPADLHAEYKQGYVYCPDDRGTGLFDFGFTRADVSIDVANGRSDFETQVDAATIRSDTDVFVERDLEGVALGAYVPGRDFRVGDLVEVTIFGVVFTLPVTQISYRGGGDGVLHPAVHVGGQLVHGADALGRHEAEMRAKLSDERVKLAEKVAEVRTLTDGKITDTAGRLEAFNAVPALLKPVREKFQAAIVAAETDIELSKRLQTEAEEAAAQLSAVSPWTRELVGLVNMVNTAQSKAIKANNKAVEANQENATLQAEVTDALSNESKKNQASVFAQLAVMEAKRVHVLWARFILPSHEVESVVLFEGDDSILVAGLAPMKTDGGSDVVAGWDDYETARPFFKVADGYSHPVTVLESGLVQYSAVSGEVNQNEHSFTGRHVLQPGGKLELKPMAKPADNSRTEQLSTLHFVLDDRDADTIYREAYSQKLAELGGHE